MGFLDQVAQRVSSEGSGGGGGGGSYSGGGRGSAYSSGSGFNWDDFYNRMSQVQYANQQNPISVAGYDGNSWNNFVQQRNDFYNRKAEENKRTFSMSGGTEDLYKNKYRKMNAPESIFATMGDIGQTLSNLPGNIAGGVAGLMGEDQATIEQRKKDWTFNPENFNPFNGVGVEDAAEVGKFALSLPGMIPGGLFEGAEKGYEAATGTPLQERRKAADGSYEVADYNLDNTQRIASGVDAFIDVAGTFTGGSAKAISVAGKGMAKSAAKKYARAGENLLKAQTEDAAREAFKGMEKAERYAKKSEKLYDIANNMGRGVFDKAGLGAGAQFAYNVGEEAGEEFIQSYADDVRMKHLDEGSLNRALTGAAWGAAGGGLMHGAGHVLNKIIHPQDTSNQSEQDATAAIDASQSHAFERDLARNSNVEGGRITDPMRTFYQEKIKDPEKLPASSSQFATEFNSNLRLRQAIISDGALRAMAQADDNNETLKQLAAKFHVTPTQVLENALNTNDQERLNTWKTWLEAAKKANGGSVKFIAGRNPDTSELGTSDVDILDIVAGDGIQLHNQLYKMLGGDVDGDKFQMYMAPGARADGYAVKHLSNPNIGTGKVGVNGQSVGKSNLDEDYSHFYKEPDTIKVFEDGLNAINEQLEKKLTDQELKMYVKTYERAIKSEDLDIATHVLDNLYAAIRARKPQNSREDLPDILVDDLLWDLEFESTKLAKTFDDVVVKLTDEQKEARAKLDKLADDDELYLRSGDTHGKYHFSDLIAFFGGKIYINTGLDTGQNPIMRQSGAYAYEMKKDEAVWFGENAEKSGGVESIYDNLIAFAFAKDNVGADVKNSIEGIWRVSVIEQSLYRFRTMTGNVRVDPVTGWNQFLGIFVQEHNQLVDKFNNSVKKITDDEFRDSLLKSTKKPISMDNMDGVAEAFHEVFGAYKIDELFDISKNNPLRGKSFNQIISDYAISSDSSVNNPFANYEGFSDFFNMLCKDEGRKQRQMGIRYYDQVSDIAKLIRETMLDDIESYVTVTEDADGNRSVSINTRDYETLRYIINSANYIFGLDVSARYGMGTIEGFLTTEYGRRYLSGDPDKMIDAVVSAKLSFLYDNAIDIATLQGDTWKADFKHELGRLATEGGLFENALYSAADKYGVEYAVEVLRYFTSLDTGWANKNDKWDYIVDNNEGAGPLLAEVFDSGNSDLGTSAFTKDLKSAKRMVTEAYKRSNVSNLDTLSRIETDLADVPADMKLDAIKHFAQSAYTTMSSHSIASFVHSQRDLVKDMIDKGVAPSSSDVLYQMIEHAKNGDVFSYLEAFDLSCGTMEIGKFQVNRVQLLNVLFDPEMEIRVYDRTTDGYVWISQKAIFEDVLGKNYTRDPNTDWSCWQDLMKKYPAFVSLLTPTHIGTMTTEGNVSVNEGMNVTLDKAISNYWREARRPQSGQYHEKQLRNEVAQLMFQDPNWWGVLIASTEGISDSESPAKTAQLVEKEIQKHVTWLMKYASMNPDGAGYQAKTLMWGIHGYQDALSALSTVINDNKIQSFLTTVLNASTGNIEQEMLFNLFNFEMSKGIRDLVEERNLDKVLDKNILDIITETDSVEESEYYPHESIRDFIDESNDDVKRAICCLLNMVDIDSFNIKQFVETMNPLNRLNEKLDEYIETLQDGSPEKVKAQASIDVFRNNISELNNDVLNDIYDYLDLNDMYYKITPEDAEGGEYSKQLFMDIIPGDAADTWTADQFKEAIKNICRDCNISDSPSKAFKQVDKAVVGVNGVRDREALIGIKNYYNQYILTYSLNNLVGEGVYNPLAAKQTIEANRFMCKLGDRVREKMTKNGHKLEYREGDLPRLTFHYTNPSTSYMSAATVMNAASGSITTGIGLDGSMMKLVAALGLLDTYECGQSGVTIAADAPELEVFKQYQGYRFEETVSRKDASGKDIPGTEHKVHHIIRTPKDARRALEIAASSPTNDVVLRSIDGCTCGACRSCAPENYSRAQANSSWMSKALSYFINWMQEPLHLKEKKSLGVIKAFADPIELDKSIVNWGREVSTTDTTIARRELLGYIKHTKNGLTKAWYGRFQEAGDALGFGKDHAKMFSNLMCQIIEVPIIVRGEDGSVLKRETVTISARDLNDQGRFDAALQSHYDRIGENIPDVVAGYEIDVSRKARPIVMSLQEISSRIVREVCTKFYNEDSQGNTPTAAQVRQWAGEAMNNMSAYNNRPLSVSTFLNGVCAQGYSYDMPTIPDSTPTPYMMWQDEQWGLMRDLLTPRKNTTAKPIPDSVWNDIMSKTVVFNENVDRPAVVVKATIDDSTYVSYGLNGLLNLPNIDEYDQTRRFGQWGNTSTQMDLVHIYVGDNAENASKAYREAARLGRKIFVPTSLVTKINGLTQLELMNSEGVVSAEIANDKYTLLNPSITEFLRSQRKEQLQIAITAMDPDELSVAVASEYVSAADAFHWVHPDFKATKAFYGATEIGLNKLLPGRNAVSLVTDPNEIANISVDDIDFQYYEDNLKNKSVENSYKKAAADYIAKMKKYVGEGNHELPMSQRNVLQNDCVGFVKQVIGGTTVYAPLYYEGSVAKTAEALRLEQSARGVIRMVYSSSNVDYTGVESMKLDLYGIAYKSVGRAAGDDILKLWAALDDFGFNKVLRADVMFDAKSLGSRVFEMGDTILHRNIPLFTHKTGLNLLFKVDDNGAWVLRDNVSSTLKKNPSLVTSICEGEGEVCEKIASGELEVFSNETEDGERMNLLVKRLFRDLLLGGVPPHIFINTAQVSYNAKTGAHYDGLIRRFVDPQIIYKYWNTDDFLFFYNFLDSRLCPKSLQDGDDGTTVFDSYGRMMNRNTRSGKPERVYTLIGPHYYTGEGTAIGDQSRSASWSMQHILKRMIDCGIYPKDVADTVSALAITTDRYDKLEKEKNMQERVSDWRERYSDYSVRVDPDMQRRVGNIVADPVFLMSQQRKREKWRAIGEEFSDPLMIVKTKNDTSAAINDKVYADKINDLKEKLNNTLKFSSAVDNLTLSEMVSLVRWQIGYTNNNGLGIQSITYNQFEDAVNEMISNLEQHQHIIVGGKYKTRGSDTRVAIPLLPRGMVTRLAASSVYSKYGGDIDAIIDDQYDMLKNETLNEIKKITDKSKRAALYNMCDSVCYINGRDTVSGHIGDNEYMFDLMQAMRDFGAALQEVDPELFNLYDEHCQLNAEYFENIYNAAQAHKTTRVILPNGEVDTIVNGDSRTIINYILRQLTAARRSMGLCYAGILPGSLLDRFVGSTTLSWAQRLGQIGIGPYRVKNRMDSEVRKACVESADFRRMWSALREAQLLGVDRELMAHIRSGMDINAAIAASFKEKGAVERFEQKFMNIMSGKDSMIEKQMMSFIDRFWQRSEAEAPWWHVKLPGNDLTIFEQKLLKDPAGLVLDLFSGSGEGKAPDALLARQCMEFAKAGDMAQKNLASAIMTEIARRSALADFACTTLVTPYFQYATNRMGRVLQWVAPISSVHYMLTDFFSSGLGSTFKFGDGTFGDLVLNDVQTKASLKEAIWCDVCHLGPGLFAMMLIGMMAEYGDLIQPPEDDAKKGDFREWTIFGCRITENWWIEDSMGLALPLVCFFASCAEGNPRMDLIVNGLSHYLSNNPVTKVADAVSILFDPMGELYKEYDNDLEGYAKAMGGPPDIWSILRGKTTSFGLSYASQFITPGILREIYNASQGNEVAYKRIFETDETGKLTMDAREKNKTQYTSYEDAVIRKYTKNNPVMGFLADIIIHPETGYMYHEMPDKVIYEPSQMNSMEAFSIYEDPYTKTTEKPLEEQIAMGYMLIATLQSNSVEDLVNQGFMIDYDTKVLVSKMISDMITTENTQWAELEQSGALNYYNVSPEDPYGEGAAIVSEMRQSHKNFVANMKSLYRDKLWADELSTAVRYNQRHTTWREDANGDWYATGYYPEWWTPITIGPGETQDGYRYVMGPENDWETQSVITGDPTGVRGLIPVDKMRVETLDRPSIDSWSDNNSGNNNGYSDLYTKMALNGLGYQNNDDTDGKNKNKTTTGYPRRYGGGGGGGRRGGGGGGGGSRRNNYTPSTSAPGVHAPISAADLPRTSLSKVNPSRIMGADRIIEANEQYLRPEFETKGSREAYKRSDI